MRGAASRPRPLSTRSWSRAPGSERSDLAWRSRIRRRMAPVYPGHANVPAVRRPTECRVPSGLGPLRDPGRTDDLPGFLLVPHVDSDLVAMLGQELAHPFLRGVLGVEHLRRQRSFVPHPPLDLEAHQTPPLLPPDPTVRNCLQVLTIPRLAFLPAKIPREI